MTAPSPYQTGRLPEAFHRRREMGHVQAWLSSICNLQRAGWLHGWKNVAMAMPVSVTASPQQSLFRATNFSLLVVADVATCISVSLTFASSKYDSKLPFSPAVNKLSR